MVKLSCWGCVVLRINSMVLIFAALMALAACSDDTPIKRFETKGLIAPTDACSSDPSRRGDVERIADIDMGNGCVVHNAYRVRGLSGVAFNQPITFNCGVANTTATWLEKVVQPAANDAFGERVVGVDVPDGYSCRPRNNVRGAKLSEHGMGNAVDISAFTLESGRKVTVEQGWWGEGDSKTFLRQVRADACGPFKTVLGPGADSHHKDHIHLDLQHHRSGGSYCR
jgi:hypothetical protein